MSSETNEKTPILVLIKGLGLGGAERLIADAAAEWDRDTYQYSVAYVLAHKNQLVPQLNDAGIETHCIGDRRGLDPFVGRRLRSVIEKIGARLVHAHLPVTGIIARISARVPVVYTEHNVATSYRQPTRTINRLTYGRNSAVVAVSTAVKSSLSGFPGPDPTVIPNGVPTASPPGTASVRSDLGLGLQTPLIVHVGNFRPHKGHHNLIEAASIVAKHRPDAMIVSIGAEKTTGDIRSAQREADREGANVRFLGRRDDARDFIAAADVVVNPSDVEGLPVTILEALAYERPVVATAVGGVPSVVIDGQTGRLVEPGDPDRLAAAILATLDNPDRALWGHRGRQLVEEHHSMAAMVAAYEDIYQSLLR